MYIRQDSNGKLWFDANGNVIYGLQNFNTSEKFAHFTLNIGTFQKLLLIDSFDRLWLSSTNSGAFCIEPPNNRNNWSFSIFTANEGLPTNSSGSIYEDNEGNMWFGSNVHFTVRFDGIQFTYFTEEQGIPYIYKSFFIEDWNKNLWFGGWSNHGVCRYEPGTSGKNESISYFSAEQGFEGNIVNGLQGRKENLWFSSRGRGLFYLK